MSTAAAALPSKPQQAAKQHLCASTAKRGKPQRAAEARTCVSVVVVARHVPVVIVVDDPRRVAEDVPYGGAAAVLVPRPLHCCQYGDEYGRVDRCARGASVVEPDRRMHPACTPHAPRETYRRRR